MRVARPSSIVCEEASGAGFLALAQAESNPYNPRAFGEPPAGHPDAQVAQLVEQRIENPRVAGSIPALGTTFPAGPGFRCRRAATPSYFPTIFLLSPGPAFIDASPECGVLPLHRQAMSRVLLHSTERTEAPARLTIAISTVGSRLPHIDPRALPIQSGWRYLILAQEAAAVEPPAALAARPDIDWLVLDSIGVAASRNRALEAAATDYLLFCDDDIRLLPERIIAFIAAFDSHPDTAILTGQTLRADMAPIKPYPGREHGLTLFNSAKTGTVEMMVRPAPVRRSGVRFNTAFGAGARHPLGDEYIFIADCLKAGLKGRYIPVAVAVHHGPSSGGDWSSPASAEARARVLDEVFGRLALPVKLAFLARHFGALRRAGGLGPYWRAMVARRTAPPIER